MPWPSALCRHGKDGQGVFIAYSPGSIAFNRYVAKSLKTTIPLCPCCVGSLCDNNAIWQTGSSRLGPRFVLCFSCHRTEGIPVAEGIFIPNGDLCIGVPGHVLSTVFHSCGRLRAEKTDYTPAPDHHVWHGNHVKFVGFRPCNKNAEG